VLVSVAERAPLTNKIAMLKRPSDLAAESNIKGFHTASDAFRSLQYFCNYKQTAINNQYSAGKLVLRMRHQIEADY
jgi:hypothetical protein